MAHVSSRPDPSRAWRIGYGLLLLNPVIGLMLTFTDPPRWLEIIGVVVIIAFVGVGTRLLFRRTGGWRPSETLGQLADDVR